MQNVYRVRLRRPRGRYRAYGCMVLGALMLYAGSFARLGPSMRVAGRADGAGALFTREETLPGVSLWLVSLFAGESEAAAQSEAARFAPRGAAGLTMKIGGAYRALGACYADGAEAEAAASRLRQTDAPGAEALLWNLPETAIRVTATRAQLSALLNADAAARGRALELIEIARAIDAGETDSLGARGALFSASAALSEAGAALAELTADENDRAAAALCDMLRLSGEELDALSRLTGLSRPELSSRVRLAQMRLTVRLRDWRRALTA